MRSIAQINNKLTHLAHIQQLSCLNRCLAGSHVQYLLPQIAAIDITHLPQHFADSIDKILSSISLDIRRQTAYTQQLSPALAASTPKARNSSLCSSINAISSAAIST